MSPLIWIQLMVLPLLLVGQWLSDWAEFASAHARGRAVWLDGARLGLGYAIFAVLLMTAGSSVTIPGFLALAALALIPRKAIIRIAGLEPKWELLAVRNRIAELAAKDETPTSHATVEVMKRLQRRLPEITTPETSDLVDLLLADLADRLRGGYWIVGRGVRAIRARELQTQMYGDQVPAAPSSPEEATFRWHLYRAFGQLVDLGSDQRNPEQQRQFRILASELDRYRRPDTAAFIDAVKASATAWLNSQSDDTWPPKNGGLEALGANIAAGFRLLCPTEAVLWGAELSDDDRNLLKTIP